MYAANQQSEVDARRAHSENFPRWKNTSCVTANDTEQLSILISKSKKNLGVGSDGDETHATKSTIQTKLEFDSSDMSPIKSEVMVEKSDKVPQSFSQSHSRKNRKKNFKHSSNKRQRKQSDGGNIQAILAIRVPKNMHDTLRDIQAALSPTLIHCIIFPVNHKDTQIQCHSFINPYKTTLSANERNSTGISVG